MHQADTYLPIPAVRAIMALMPAPALERSMAAVMRRMQSRHPRLFRNLAALKPAVVHIEPSDIPHKFLLEIGDGRSALSLLREDAIAQKPHALIRGNLSSLLDMLEGRTDGDTLFFSRSLLISGDTVVIVALRNTLDREAINLLDDFLPLLGPFAAPASKALAMINRIGNYTTARRKEFHDAMHFGQNGGRDLAAECASLRAEMAEVKTRLAKSEARQRRNEAQA